MSHSDFCAELLSSGERVRASVCLRVVPSEGSSSRLQRNATRERAGQITQL